MRATNSTTYVDFCPLTFVRSKIADSKQACATKLAPAKAHLVNLAKSPPWHSKLPTRTTSLWGCRPSTPYKPSPRRMTLFSDPSMDDGDIDREATIRRRCQRPQLRPNLSDLYSDVPMHARYKFIRPRPYGLGSLSPDSSDNLIDAINGIIRSFPKDMLFLDSPAILDIRLKTDIERHHPSKSGLSSNYPPSLQNRPRKYIRRRTKSSCTCKRFESADSAHPLVEEGSNIPVPTIKARIKVFLNPPATLPLRQSASAPPPPNLAPFRKVFPQADDWRLSVLYAHVIAYNHIQDCRSTTSTPSTTITKPSTSERINPTDKSKARPCRPHIPSKASHTLGFSNTHNSNRNTNASTSQTAHMADIAELDPRFEKRLEKRLLQTEEALVNCIQRITRCIYAIGDNWLRGADVADLERRWDHPETADGAGDATFVRALAELVRACERGGDGDPNGVRVMET